MDEVLLSIFASYIVAAGSMSFGSLRYSKNVINIAYVGIFEVERLL